MIMRKLYTPLLLLLVSNVLWAEHFELLPYGDMNSWVVRYITESRIIGGKTKTLYAIAPTDTIRGNIPFEYGREGNPWSVSNAYAKAAGVDKTSGTTSPERRGDGYCARMDCRLETMELIGIDIKLQIAGTIFTGKTYEPVPMRGASDPYSIVEMGVPFTREPIALQLDYKARIEDSNIITKAKPLAGCKQLEGRDYAEIYVFLQKRWEENGHIYAYRVGTAFEQIWHDIPDWINEHKIPIKYGDISTRADFKDYESYGYKVFRAKNKEGKMVEVEEVGFSNDKPTHMVLMISSGRYPAFTGHNGNTLWVDNVGFVYND